MHPLDARWILMAQALQGRLRQQVPLPVSAQKHVYLDEPATMAKAFEHTETYKQGDTVSFEGKRWRCRADNVTGHAGDSSLAWELL